MKGEIEFYESRPQCEHPDCPFCAKMYFTWVKERIKQMSVPRKRKVMPSGFVKPTETVSFDEAAGTSNVPPRVKPVNTCNRHLDCDEADKDTKLGHPERIWGADHCYDSCCEDCFGY